MARKKKPKAEAIAMVDADYKPQTHIDLDEDSVDSLEDFSIGDEVCVVLRGKVVSMESRESKYGGRTEKRGMIAIENPDVCIHPADSEEHAESLQALYDDE